MPKRPIYKHAGIKVKVKKKMELDNAVSIEMTHTLPLFDFLTENNENKKMPNWA